jgi:GNAT superfamily N-acetyltransferase
MYVRPVHRRKGISRTLMWHAEQLARKAGAHEVMLSTGFDNTEGQALYRSVGYSDYALTMRKEI